MGGRGRWAGWASIDEKSSKQFANHQLNNILLTSECCPAPMWTPTKPGLAEPCSMLVQALREVAQALKAPPARHHIEPLLLLLLAPRPPGRAAAAAAGAVPWCSSAGSLRLTTHPQQASSTHSTPTHVQFAPAAWHQPLCKAHKPLAFNFPILLS